MNGSLTQAVREGNFANIKSILDSIAASERSKAINVRVSPFPGDYPPVTISLLLWSIKWDRIDIAQLLIYYGANVGYIQHLTRHTPLEVAITRSQLDVVRSILRQSTATIATNGGPSNILITDLFRIGSGPGKFRDIKVCIASVLGDIQTVKFQMNIGDSEAELVILQERYLCYFGASLVWELLRYL